MFKVEVNEPKLTEDHPQKEVLIQEPKFLETVYNRIYFYSEIDRGAVLNFNKNLREMANSHISDAQIRGIDKPVHIQLHIQSYGGGIFSGFAAMDELIEVAKLVDVHTVIDGCCASAATFISIMGTTRYINKHAFMLIHQLSNVMWGKYEEFRDEMTNMDILMETIRNLYREKTRLPEDKIQEILKHDLWFDANKCLEYGLVDAIL
jgi:ATP-dependent protease ClpP protease subunit